MTEQGEHPFRGSFRMRHSVSVAVNGVKQLMGKRLQVVP